MDRKLSLYVSILRYLKTWKRETDTPAQRPRSRLRWLIVIGLMSLIAAAAMLLLLDTPSPVHADTVVSGTLYGNNVWTTAGSPYVVQGGVDIASGAVLTIQPGVVVRFTSNTTLRVFGNGSLIADGTPTQPITFTSAATNPQPGNWAALILYGGSRARLSYCDVAYAGAGNSGTLNVDRSDVAVRNCRIHHSSSQGVYLYGSALTPTLENLTIDNSGAAVYQLNPDMSPIYRNLSLSGNNPNAIVTSGEFSRPSTWDLSQAGAPMWIDSGVTINSGGVLTVTPGSEIRFNTNALLRVFGNGALIADGTPTQPITFTSSAANPQPGDWARIAFFAGARGRLSYCDVAYAGAGNSGTLNVDRSDVAVRNCRIHHSSSQGVYLYGSALTPTLENLTIDNNSGAAVYQLNPDMSPIYRNLSLSNNNPNAIVTSGDFYAPSTWDLSQAGAPMWIDSGVTINSGGVLTVTPGSEIRFNTNALLRVFGGGALIADGTVSQPITFTSAATNPQPGNWAALILYGGSRARLSYCDVAYAGAGNYPKALDIESSDVAVRNCHIHHNLGPGVYLYGGYVSGSFSPTLENLTINNNTGTAVYPGAAVYQANPDMSPIYRNLMLSGNNPNVVLSEGGYIAQNITWDLSQAGTPIWLNGGITVNAGRFFALSPGTTVRFITGTAVYVNGNFYALGDSARPVILNGVVEQPGTWGGVNVAAGAKAILSECELANGGRSGLAMLSLAANAIVQNCRIHHSAGDGISVSSAQPVIAGNQIYSNTFGLRNTTPATIVDARNNWWGSPTGPKHASNPTGTGDPVSDGVLFNPWLQSPAGAALPPQLVVQLAGPSRAAPGQTVDYAVFYLNQLTQTVENAVLMIALPTSANFVDSTAGGIYWPERNQVFWRLGNLSPGTSGIVSVRVRYLWGLPQGLQDSALALLGGTNLNLTAFDVGPYLIYSPTLLVMETNLSDAQFQAERQASSDLNTIYSQAIAGGFILGTADRLTLSSGTVLTRVILMRPDQDAVMYIQRRSDLVIASSFDRTSYAIRDATGGITISLEFDNWSAWGSWASALSPSNVEFDVDRAHCMLNCMLEKFPKYTIKRLSTFVKFVLKGYDCVKAALGDKPSVIKCANSLKDVFPDLKGTTPGLSEVVDVYKCAKDCKENLASHLCTGDLITCETGWNDLFYWSGKPHYGIIRCNKTTGTVGLFTEYVKCPFSEENQKCVEGVGCVSCGNTSLSTQDAGSTSVNDAPHGPLTIDRSTATGSFCKLMAGTGIGCSANRTTIQIARDPNAKYGPVGDVLPGQLVTYTITYENEGQGNAYGVYVVDQLNQYLDESTLTVFGNGTFITPTRTIIWDIGELGPKGTVTSTGAVSFTVRLKTGLPGGTVVMNQAVVYFPSVPEQTPTNVVVNVVQPVSALPQTVQTGAMTPVVITLQGQDVSNAPLTYSIVSTPLNGQLSGNAPSLTYTPANNFTGEDRFTFKVSNGITESRAAEVRIIVLPSASDTTPPQVRWTAPVNGATNVNVTTSPIFVDNTGPLYGPFITIQFTEAMSETTISAANIQLLNSQGQPVPVSVLYDGTTNQAVLLPRAPLQGKSTYTIKVLQQVRDASGNLMSADYSASFTTAPVSSSVYLPLIIR